MAKSTTHRYLQFATTVLFAYFLLLAMPFVAADTVSIGVSGVIHDDGSPGAQEGELFQVGPLGPLDDLVMNFTWGAIDSYSAPEYLPQVGPDLEMYGWSIVGTVDTVDEANTLVTYSGTFHICAPGYGYDTVEECLESGLFTMTADYAPDWSTADVQGTLVLDPGVQQPPEWPVPVDWSVAGPVMLAGTFTSLDNTLTATLSAEIPPPTEVWVDDDYALLEPGIIINNETLYGYNAFSTIQAAVDAVADGGVVHVADGTYAEAVLVDKAVLIEGSGSELVTIDASSLSAGHCSPAAAVCITADSVGFTGFTIDGDTANSAISRGLKVTGDSVVVKDVIVQGTSGTGVDVINTDGVFLIDVASVATDAAGFFLKNTVNTQLSGILTMDNPWGGMGIGTDGNYDPSSTSVVFVGSSSFYESYSSATGPGLYLEEFRSGDDITYGLAMGDVVLAHTNMSYALHGFNHPDTDIDEQTHFYQLLEDAAAAALEMEGAGLVEDSGLWIERLSDGAIMVTEGMDIQDAIDAANPGDTIVIGDGVFTEGFIIDKDVTIIGDGSSNTTTIYLENATGHCSPLSGICITAEGASLIGFELIGSPNAAGNSRALKVVADNVWLEDLLVEDANGVGIDIIGTTNVTVYDVAVLDTGGAGMFLKNNLDMQLIDVMTAGNPWGGIGIGTDGAYAQDSTSVTFSGDNVLMEGYSALSPGLYFEQYRSGQPISYGFSGTEDVVLTGTNMSFAIHGYDHSDPLTDWQDHLYVDLDAAGATAVAMGQAGIWIERLADGAAIVPEGLSIQDAADGVGAYGKVVVLAGNFSEKVLLDEPITLLGNNVGIPYDGSRYGESILDGMIVFQSSDIIVDGFTLLNGDTHWGERSAIYIQGGSDFLVQNNVFMGPGTGLPPYRGMIVSTYSGLVENISVVENEFTNWYSAPYFNPTKGLLFANNSVHDNAWGVGTDRLEDGLFTGNVFTGNGEEAIGFFGAQNATVYWNSISGHDWGVKNYGGVPVDARFNWWGAADGPSGNGNGSGDAISENVTFEPWLPAPWTMPYATVSVKPPYPMNETYVFSCDSAGYDALTYDWTFDDGAKLEDINASEIMHSYSESGTYTVFCAASKGDITYTDTLEVNVSVPPAPQPPASLNMYVKPPFPKKNHVVLVCQPHDFEPLGIDYAFGDGSKLYDVDNRAVYHKYATPGNYTASCVASDGETTLVDWVQVSIPEAPAVSLEVTELSDDTYALRCDASGFLADIQGYDFAVWDTATGEQVFGPVYDIAEDSVNVTFAENGPYMASCTATADGETRIDTKRFAVTGVDDTPVTTPATATLEVVLRGNTATLVVPDADNLSDIRISAPRNVKERYVDFTAMLNESDGSSAFLPMTAWFIANTARGDVDVMLPAGMTIYGEEGWDGIMELPTAQSAPGLAGKRVSAVIKIGSDVDLTFDKGVRILFADKAGEDVGFLKDGELVEITDTCPADAQWAADALAPGADCTIDVGDDLVVWTKHFTEFVTYTDAPGSSRSSGRGGGYFASLQDFWGDEPTEPAKPAEKPAKADRSSKDAVDLSEAAQAPAEDAEESSANPLTGRATGEGAVEDASSGWLYATLVLGLAIAALVVVGILRQNR